MITHRCLNCPSEIVIYKSTKTGKWCSFDGYKHKFDNHGYNVCPYCGSELQ